MEPTISDLAGSEPIFVLEIDWNGQTHRFSTYPISFDGNEYIGNLEDFVYTEKSDLLGVDLEANSFSCAVYFDGLDMVEEWRKGRTIEGSAASLAYILIREGEIVSTDMILLLEGEVQQPVFGDPDEPRSFCAFTVERKGYDLEIPLLDPVKIIDKEKFPNLDEDTASSKMYPLIIGQPGKTRSEEGLTVNLFCTPAYNHKRYTLGHPSGDVYFLIAGHDVEATTVQISDGVKTPISKTVLRAADLNGNFYSYVDMTGESFLYPGFTLLTDVGKQPNEWFVSWTDGGGMANPYGDGLLEGGGDICIWVLTKSLLPVDRGAWFNIREFLNTFKFAGFINDPSLSCWSFLSEYILPHLPIEVKPGPNGLRPILNQMYSYQITQPRKSIVAGSNFKRISAITTQTDTADIINGCLIRYAKNSFDENHYGSVRIAADATNTDADRQNLLSISSENRYGKSETTIESDFIYDRGTAARVAYFKIRSNAFPVRTFRYEADVEFGYLQLGDVIILTDEDLFLDDTKGTVIEKSWNETNWIIGICIEETPRFTDRYFEE